MDRIEVVTKPDKRGESPVDSTQEEIVQKLKKLVDEKLSPSDGDGEDDKSKWENDNKTKHGSESKGRDASDDTELEYDHDGFEVPPDKIPLDGHFSTSEVKVLVDIAQKEGLLDKSVDVEVVEGNKVVGDRVVIKDNSDEETDDAEEEKDEKKETK